MIKNNDKKYVDLTNGNWKGNYLIGKEIINRPWKKPILFLSISLFTFSLLTPFTNFFMIPLSLWVLKTHG